MGLGVGRGVPQERPPTGCLWLSQRACPPALGLLQADSRWDLAGPCLVTLSIWRKSSAPSAHRLIHFCPVRMN